MGTPHKHAELIKAWADGAEIEINITGTDMWVYREDPAWLPESEYRVKPEPKPDVVRYFGIDREESYSSLMLTERQLIHYSWNQYIKITFDGETGKLKAVEIIK